LYGVLVLGGTVEKLPDWARALLLEEPVGHLGLTDTAGYPRVLPVTYTIREGAAWTAVDNKPKRAGRELARIRWGRERPHASLTVDHYDDDWSALRWVQLIGQIAVVEGPPAGEVLEALLARYPQYRRDGPPGPVMRLTVARALCWRAQ
jgi:PPOX class probable F420-dependent enzyme